MQPGKLFKHCIQWPSYFLQIFITAWYRFIGAVCMFFLLGRVATKWDCMYEQWHDGYLNMDETIRCLLDAASYGALTSLIRCSYLCALTNMGNSEGLCKKVHLSACRQWHQVINAACFQVLENAPSLYILACFSILLWFSAGHLLTHIELHLSAVFKNIATKLGAKQEFLIIFAKFHISLLN